MHASDVCTEHILSGNKGEGHCCCQDSFFNVTSSKTLFTSMFIFWFITTWVSSIFMLSLCFCSASAYSRAKSDQPQLNRYPGELAAAACQGEPRSVVCIQTILSHSCRQHSHLCGDTSEQHWISPGGPAAWHHLPAPHGCSHPCGLVWAFSVDIPPYT